MATAVQIAQKRSQKKKAFSVYIHCVREFECNLQFTWMEKKNNNNKQQMAFPIILFRIKLIFF